MIGILEMSSDSTQFYLKEMETRSKRVSIQSFNTDFEMINELFPKPNPKLKSILKSYLSEVERSNVQQLILPNITIHETIDELFEEENYSFKIIHPLTETIHKLEILNINEVIIFGSYYTMQQSFISDTFSRHKIKANFPNQKDKELIDETRKLVYQGKANKNVLQEFNQIIKKYATQKTVVLCCTELSIAVDNQLINVLDMARIQIDAVLKSTD